MKNKKILLVLLIMILLTSIVGTFAWLSWSTSESALKLTVGTIESVRVSLSPYRINSSITPSTSYDYETDTVKPIVTMVDAVNNKNEDSLFNLYYRVNNIDEELKDENFKYTILKSTDGSTYSEYKTGNFLEASNGSELVILEETIPTGSTYLYKVYVWIDGNNGDQSSMQGKVFDGELRANISSTDNIIVDQIEGLIPVTIANDGSVTTVSPDSSNWYNYDEKKWANGILVTESSRSNYVDKYNVSVAEEDILAYYVYIPRYKYKIWTLTTGSSPQEIEIIFENKYMNKSKGDAVGEYYTHPAFTFGDTELNGIWVGKFETSADSESDCYKNVASTEYCDTLEIEPRIKPNVPSVNYMRSSYHFKTALKFAGGTMDDNGNVTFAGSSLYGLKNTTDSHQIKNSEWGAAAYLSHSTYGINGEIRFNNYWDSSIQGILTGCGASSDATGHSNTCSIPYGNSSTYPQSTTGNISGVFDMSGGMFDFVMGNFDGTTSDEFPVLPNDSKYYDLYPASIFDGDYTTNMSKCDLATCGGHALYETSGWYSDDASFVYSVHFWFIRGYQVSSPTISGAFGARGNNNSASINSITSRSVLVKTVEEEPTITLSLSKEGYVEGFRGWNINPSYASLDTENQILTINTNNIHAAALSYFYPVDELDYAWWFEYYTENAASAHTPKGGFYLNTAYYDKNFAAYTATNGYNGNGDTGATNLNTWSEFSRRASMGFGYGKNLEYVIFNLNSSDTYSVAPTKYRNFRVGGDLYAKDKYTINVSVGSDVTVRKYASGNRNPYYFENNGQNFTGNSFDVYANGVYTVYVEDSEGNYGINYITINKIDNDAPVVSSFTNDNGDLTVVAKDSMSGIVAYQFTSTNQEPQSWTRVNNTTENVTVNYTIEDIGMYYVWFVDAAGNVMSRSINITADGLDGVGPDGSVTATLSNGVVTATITATDESGVNSTYGWKISTSSSCNASTTDFVDSTSNPKTFTLSSSGIYYVCAKVSDTRGNISYIRSNSIDGVAPTGSVSASLSGSTITATLTASDDSGLNSTYGWKVSTSETCDSSLSFTDSTNNPYSFTVTDSGTYYVCTRVKDKNGNTSYIRSSGVSVILSVTVTLNGGVSEKITYSGTTSGSVTLGTNGSGTVALSPGTYTFSGGTSGYSTGSVAINAAKTVNVHYPGAIFWYGNGDQTGESLYSVSGGFSSNTNHVSTSAVNQYYESSITNNTTSIAFSGKSRYTTAKRHHLSYFPVNSITKGSYSTIKVKYSYSIPSGYNMDSFQSQFNVTNSFVTSYTAASTATMSTSGGTASLSLSSANSTFTFVIFLVGYHDGVTVQKATVSAIWMQ